MTFTISTGGDFSHGTQHSGSEGLGIWHTPPRRRFSLWSEIQDGNAGNLGEGSELYTVDRKRSCTTLGCPKCSFYPGIKTFSGILNGAGLFPSTVWWFMYEKTFTVHIHWHTYAYNYPSIKTTFTKYIYIYIHTVKVCVYVYIYTIVYEFMD